VRWKQTVNSKVRGGSCRSINEFENGYAVKGDVIAASHCVQTHGTSEVY
jgi:hypothetical protein